MIVGVLKERKTGEHRVAITPAGVEVMKHHGQTVLVESGAGAASGFADGEYAAAGAEIVASAATLFHQADMLLQVKEPQASEYRHLRQGQVYFAYLHLASSPAVARALLAAGTVGIDYFPGKKQSSAQA